MNDLAIRVQTWLLKEILRWREYLPYLVEAIRKVLGNNVEIYVFGSAVENRLTVNSDIDIAVIMEKVPERARDRAKILDEIWRELETRGVPWWYPFEIHLMTRQEMKRLKKGGAKFVRVEDLMPS